MSLWVLGGVFCLFEAGLEESVNMLKQKVQLLSERNTLGCDYVLRCCCQPCLNTNVKGDPISAITMVQIKILIPAAPSLFAVWPVVTLVVTWKTKWDTKNFFFFNLVKFTCALVIVGWPDVSKSKKNGFIIELPITHMTLTWLPFWFWVLLTAGFTVLPSWVLQRLPTHHVSNGRISALVQEA